MLHHLFIVHYFFFRYLFFFLFCHWRIFYFFFFFFNDTATTEIYTLSLHDALPIFGRRYPEHNGVLAVAERSFALTQGDVRSEEHTSELQSQSNLVCRLLLEKKKTKSRFFSLTA